MVQWPRTFGVGIGWNRALGSFGCMGINPEIDLKP